MKAQLLTQLKPKFRHAERLTVIFCLLISVMGYSQSGLYNDWQVSVKDSAFVWTAQDQQGEENTVRYVWQNDNSPHAVKADVYIIGDTEVTGLSDTDGYTINKEQNHLKIKGNRYAVAKRKAPEQVIRKPVKNTDFVENIDLPKPLSHFSVDRNNTIGVAANNIPVSKFFTRQEHKTSYLHAVPDQKPALNFGYDSKTVAGILILLYCRPPPSQTLLWCLQNRAQKIF